MTVQNLLCANYSTLYCTQSALPTQIFIVLFQKFWIQHVSCTCHGDYHTATVRWRKCPSLSCKTLEDAKRSKQRWVEIPSPKKKCRKGKFFSKFDLLVRRRIFISHQEPGRVLQFPTSLLLQTLQYGLVCSSAQHVRFSQGDERRCGGS